MQTPGIPAEAAGAASAAGNMNWHETNQRNDAILLRTGVALLVLVAVLFFWWKPWLSRDPMPPGDYIITYLDNNGRLAERREHVWKGIKTREEAIRNLQGRYPNALDIRHSPPPRFSLRFSRGEWYFFTAGLAPIVMIGAGALLRRRNMRCHRIANLLRHNLETDVDELLRNTDYSRVDIEQAVRTLNNRGLGFFVWNRVTDTIEDGRLGSTYLHIERCESCGASVGLKIKASLKEVPRCSYCNSGVSTHEHLNELKRQSIRGIRNSDASAISGALSNPHQPMSIWLFVFLVLICWPAAIAYAVYKSSVKRATGN